MMKAILFSVASVAVSSSAGHTIHTHTISRELQQTQVDCNSENEEVATLDLLLDDHPEETGFTMICDDAVIWQVEQGALAGQASSWVSNHYCAPRDVKNCALTITDASGNGLQGDGWYSFVFGATTIAVYDGLPFFEDTKCFGSACDQVAQEVADLESECNPVLFDIQLDDKPEETSFILTCDDKTVWDVTGLDTPFSNTKLEECIPRDTCCVLTILDQGNDGLTSGNATHSGYFALEADYQDKIRYDGSRGTQFSSLSVAFGSDKCSSKASVVVSGTNEQAASPDKTFTVGAVVGAFFGGAVGSLLLVGVVYRLLKGTETSSTTRSLNAQPTSDEPFQDDGLDTESKGSKAEQMTVHSDAEQSA